MNRQEKYPMLSLSQQLIILLISFISLTATLMAGVNYWILKSNLEMQIEARLDLGRHYTESLWQVIHLQTIQTLDLLAERPTLNRLLQSYETEPLNSYLATFQESTDLNFLYLTDNEGNYLAGSTPDDTIGKYIWERSLDKDIKIVGGIYLNQPFLEKFASKSPFSYHLLNYTPIQNNYRAETILLGREFKVVMLLSVEDILLNQQYTLFLLIGITLGTVVLASSLGGLFIRRRIHPLRCLKDAAQRMGEGDLDSPIPHMNNLSSDINTLRQTLESSRQAISKSLHEIQAQRDWANSLMQVIVEGIVTYNKEGYILFHSESTAQMMQWRKSKVGRNLDDVFRITEEDSLFSDVLPLDGHKQVDLLLEDGRSISVLITGAKNLISEEYSLVLRNITEESRRTAAQSYYIAHMSHEFRTPLSGMKASVELLHEHLGNLSIEEERRLLNSISISILSLQNLIDNLLEGSKLEIKQFSLRRQKLLIEDILTEAIGMMQFLLSRRRQDLEVKQSNESVLLWLDKIRMVQVMVNLLSNASKYSPEGSLIQILVEKRQNRLWLGVVDRGVGVPDGDKERIFQHFVRLESSAESDHSTGLGLAVVRGIIEAHGGQVGVKAHEGGGSIFWFELTLGEDERL